MRSKFSEISPTLSPRFGIKKSIKIKAIPNQLSFVNDFKIQFEFFDHRFQTPWLTIASNVHGRHIKKIIFKFEFSDDEIVSIKTKSICKLKLIFSK
eukprot:gene359-6773_t